MFAPPAHKKTSTKTPNKKISPMRQTNQKPQNTNHSKPSNLNPTNNKNIKLTYVRNIYKSINLNKIASIRTLPPFVQINSGSNSQNKSS